MPKSPDYFHNTMNLPFFARKNGPAAKRDHFATDPIFMGSADMELCAKGLLEHLRKVDALL